MKCASKNCRGISTKSGKSPYCSKCRSRRWAKKFPLHYMFKALRNHAKERRKDFSLTRAEFVSFAIKTDYARLHGRRSLSLSIDRRDNKQGYHAHNIQALTVRDNCRKQFVDFYANQTPNVNYEPTEEEIAEAEKANQDL